MQTVAIEWLKSAHDMALSIDGGLMWFSRMIEILHNWRPGGQLREKGEYWM
jgi:hypothetical protein